MLRRISPRQHDFKRFWSAAQKVDQRCLFDQAVVAGGDRLVEHEQIDAVRALSHHVFQQRGIGQPRRRFRLPVHRLEKAEVLLAARDLDIWQRAQDIQFRRAAVLQKLRKQHALSSARRADAQSDRRGRLAFAIAAVQVNQSLHAHTSRFKMR